MKDTFCKKLEIELKKHFEEGLPEKVEEIMKRGKKDIDEQNHQLTIADEFGFPSLRDFIKEDLARDDKEEKKLKAMRKEKRERERCMPRRGATIGASEGAFGVTGTLWPACRHRGRVLVTSPAARTASSSETRVALSATTASGSGIMPGTAPSLSLGAGSRG